MTAELDRLQMELRVNRIARGRAHSGLIDAGLRLDYWEARVKEIEDRIVALSTPITPIPDDLLGALQESLERSPITPILSTTETP